MGSVKRKRNVDNGQEQAKKNKESENETEIIILDQKITKLPIVASSWLENFLSQKRDSIVTAAEEHDVADDTYLREFSLQFTKSIPQDEGDDSDNEGPIINSGSSEIEQISVTERTESQIGDCDVEDVSLAASAKLKLFNLPYRIKSKEIGDLFSKFGFPDVIITMDIDKRTSLPAGSASVELVPGSDVVEAVKALHGQNCGGRPLKVLSQKAVVKKSRPSGGRADRYFLGIDVVCDLKCNSCGKGGHKAADCDAGPVHPCHLCAARDHESGDCPNITCFRCGEFGHHSKSCNNARRSSRAFICTICASSTHDARNCLQVPEKAQARLEDSCIRCMRCNKLGHALCEQETVPEKRKSKGIYCPNCGMEGHHVDYPNDSSRAGSIVGGLNICQAPRYDAYLKFPQLLRNIDRICSSGDRDVQTDFYQSLVWSAGSGEQVQRMFPSLCRTKSSGEHDLRRKTMSASDFSSSRNHSNTQDTSDKELLYSPDYNPPEYSTYRDSPSAERDAPRRGYNASGQSSSSSRRHSGYEDSSSRNQDRQRDSREYNGRRVIHDDVPYHDRNQGRRSQTVFHDSLPRRASISNYDNSRDSGRIARRY